MTIDDPFAEPGDGERTIIRPNPGGRQAPAQPQPQDQPQPQTQPQPAEATPLPRPPVMPQPSAAGRPIELPPLKSLNPLVNAALPLLDLGVQVKNRAVHSDIERLRDRVVAEINAFERKITPIGLAPQTIR